MKAYYLMTDKDGFDDRVTVISVTSLDDLKGLCCHPLGKRIMFNTPSRDPSDEGAEPE